MTTFQKYVQFLRTQFPPGSRVLPVFRRDPYSVRDSVRRVTP